MSWGGNPFDPNKPSACCFDATCAACLVKSAGARELGRQAGFVYDDCPPDVQWHYREICGAIMAEMSESLIETGLAQVKG